MDGMNRSEALAMVRGQLEEMVVNGHAERGAGEEFRLTPEGQARQIDVTLRHSVIAAHQLVARLEELLDGAASVVARTEENAWLTASGLVDVLGLVTADPDEQGDALPPPPPAPESAPDSKPKDPRKWDGRYL